MRWTLAGAHLLLQIRVQVLNGDWRATLSRWYPGMQLTPEPKALSPRFFPLSSMNVASQTPKKRWGRYPELQFLSVCRGETYANRQQFPRFDRFGHVCLIAGEQHPAAVFGAGKSRQGSRGRASPGFGR